MTIQWILGILLVVAIIVMVFGLNIWWAFKWRSMGRQRGLTKSQSRMIAQMALASVTKENS